MKRRVLFNKISAVLWLVLGIISFPLGWANSVVIVWLASVYANVKTDWGAAEAADDSKVIKEIRELKQQVAENNKQLEQVTNVLTKLLAEESNKRLTTRD